jgi:hypothetical protein
MAAPVPQTGAGNVTTASNNSATSLVFTKPSNTADGDLLVCMVYFRNSGSAGSAPAGWSSSARSELTLATHMTWYKHITSASGEAATYTFTTPNGSNRCLGIMFRVTGARPTSFENAVSTVQTTATGGGTGATIAALTTTVDNCLILANISASNASGTPSSITPAAGMTEIGETTVIPGVSSDMEASYVVLATAGSSGTKAPTWTPASTSMSAYLVAIEPANVDLNPSGIATAGAFGTASITQARVISPSGIPPLDEMLDEMTLGFGPWGIPTVTLSVVTQVISPSGIATANAFGTATVTSLPPILRPDGIFSGEDFGIADVTITAPDGTILVTSIASAEAFGTARVQRGVSETGTVFIFDKVGDYWQSDRPLRYRIPIAISLVKVDGVWREVAQPSEELVNASTYYFPGGRVHPIGDDVATELINAGYGAYVLFGSS